MQILGIDYGRKKIGLALGNTESGLADPFAVIRYEDVKTLKEKLDLIIKSEGIEKIVLGVSEGEMGKEIYEFGEDLGKMLDIPVEFFDETLSTRDAQSLSIQAGINRKKRKNMEDAYAATVVLQSYLDQ